MASRGNTARRVFADPNKQELLERNWDPIFKRDDECWVSDEKRQEVFGPFKFARYSPQSCIVLGKYDNGNYYSRRVKFMYGQRIFQTEREAKSCIMMTKVLKYMTMKAEMAILHKQILELSEGRINLNG